ncbi:hypothetical protein MHBO_003479, partial [Bonamia ostreae]
KKILSQLKEALEDIDKERLLKEEKERKILQLEDKLNEKNNQIEKLLKNEKKKRKNIHNNNLFEIYSSNSKKAKNIIDEELELLKKTLDENIYSKSNLSEDSADSSFSAEVEINKKIEPKITKKNKIALEKNVKKKALKNFKDSKKEVKKSAFLAKSGNIKKKVSFKTAEEPVLLFSQNAVKEKIDGKSPEPKRLSLRERIEMSKNL